MPSTGGGAGSYGPLIVTPDMVPPDAAHWDAQEQSYKAGATAWDGIHQQIVQDNAAFRDAADSTGFDSAHQAGAMLAEEAKTISEWHAGVAKKCNGIAVVLRETAAGQDQLVRDADTAINAAKLPGERETLVATYHAQARTQTGWGVEAAMALHTSFKATAENTRALDLLTRYGDIAASPSIQPVDHETSPGIAQEDDPYKRTSKPELGEEKSAPEAAKDASGAPSTQAGIKPATQAGQGAGDTGIATATGPVTQATPGVTSPRQSASSLGGMPSMGGMGTGGGGGLGSGGLGSGGGMPKMPGGLGGGGMPGMGSNPLSSGMGQVPGAGSGLPGGGVPGASTGAGSPAAAFTQGMSTGASIGGGMPSTPPAPPSPSPALTGGGHAAPVAPVSAAPGGGVSPASAQPGMVAPPASAAAAPTGAGMGTGGGAPMMLPPGSMGPPAGAAPPPPATVPAGTLAAGGNAPATSPPPAGAGGGATLIPASVVAAGQSAAARERRESADAAAAKELAWKLQHAAQAVGYPIEWAVGVFRSPSGTETVVTSNDGASYIPAGVYVPRSARVLATDPLVDDHFRQLWFGWADPARVLIEYAQLRAEMGWRLVAAATTGPLTALRDAGVEHPPSCTRQTNPLLQPGQQTAAPGMDGMHEHRLAALWPDVYPRLLRVMDADPLLQDRIVAAASALLMNTATTQGVAVEGGIPNAVRQIWLTRGGDQDPSPQQWAEYDAAAKDFNTVTSIFRPGFVGQADPSETIEELARYRAHWMVARTAELIGGWATRPLPLPDMCYAAAAAGNVHIRDLIVESLASVEEDLVHAG
ncbi:hypothetical protein ACTWP6_23935 [Mycobacterium sp. 4D054]|uniref:hypothetical protein n=1 Tax=Mycobacteriaceae TaxID=1762 RepID=UPI000D86359E|nr:hypothetical protein [Mycolicibacterium chubuense]SPX89411.1 putative methyl-accepting chemotaxis sensory transducer [Mycolicibacterium chubuense]